MESDLSRDAPCFFVESVSESMYYALYLNLARRCKSDA